MQCSQCDRAAFYEMQNGAALCVEHYNMVAQNAQAAMAANATMINYLSDRINATFGLPPQGPRIHIPQPVIHEVPVTHNHINIDRSVIGAINTAQVERIDVAMQNIQNGGDPGLSTAFKELTEAIIQNQQINDSDRRQLVENLTFLAEQAALPDQQRQKGIAKIVVQATSGLIATAANAATIWGQWHAHISALFP
jgi:hypothetical protein